MIFFPFVRLIFIITVVKKKNKNKFVPGNDVIRTPSTTSTTTTTTTTSTTTERSVSYPPAPVYFKERKKKRKQHLTESKMYYMPFKANGQPNLKTLLDTMAQSGLFDSNGISQMI